jgi:hypothetical protein
MKRTPLRRGKPLARGTTRLKARKGGSLFPEQRDDTYRRAVRGCPCLLVGHLLAARISPNDQPAWRAWVHVCWGPIDPAHIGPHQAVGVPDRQHILPLCRAAHQFYDEHRISFYRATGYSHHQLALLAREFVPAEDVSGT